MADNAYLTDVEFLKEHTDVVELTSPDGAKVAVTPAFQARVMTSTPSGTDGQSFGWINRALIAAECEDEHFNNYGGEDRFWLGPEAGQFGLWFAKGEPFELDLWTTPGAFGSGAFEIAAHDDASVSTATRFDVTNYSGTIFRCDVERTIATLSAAQAAELLGATIPAGVQTVGFESRNTLTNAGQGPWTRDAGLVSIWTLGQFNAPPNGTVIVPFRSGSESELGPKATTDYFGELPPERCTVRDDHLLFCCDGQWRSKIGIAPAWAKNVCGSYDPGAGVLTIVQFNLPENAAALPYVNSRWEIQDEPFAGDAINAYSDGPGSGHDTASVRFYELETSSPAAELAAGESMTHCHRTFHFVGEFESLRAVATAVLAMDLNEVK